jgi:hypothetical protein
MVAPLFLTTKYKSHSTHGTKLRQQPLTTWQVSFGLDYLVLPTLVKFLSALFHLRITH